MTGTRSPARAGTVTPSCFNKQAAGKLLSLSVSLVASLCRLVCVAADLAHMHV